MTNANDNPQGVREYIGARYVPVIAGEWDITKAYEPLTIVLNQGDSYTSKQYVPQGVELTNETYWALTGNFNGQIASMQNDIVDLKSNQETQNVELSNLQQNQDTQNVEISNLQQNLEKVRKRAFICLGDSYGSGTYRNNANTAWENDDNGWLKYMKDVMGARTGCTVYSNYDAIIPGNSGFTSEGAFITVLQKLHDEVIEDPSSITDVVVLAGTNDRISTEEEIYTAVTAFCAKVYELFPNTQRLKVGYVSVFVEDANQASSVGVINGYRKACEKYGGEYLWSLKNLFAMRQYIGPDGGHPNQAGYLFFRDYLIDAVFNGNVDYRIVYEVPTSLTEPGYTYVQPYLQAIVTPESIQLDARRAAAAGPLWSVKPNEGTIERGQTIPTKTFNIEAPLLPKFTSYYSLELFTGTLQYLAISGVTNQNWQISSYGPAVFVSSAQPTTLQFWVPSYIYNQNMNYIEYDILGRLVEV